MYASFISPSLKIYFLDSNYYNLSILIIGQPPCYRVSAVISNARERSRFLTEPVLSHCEVFGKTPRVILLRHCLLFPFLVLFISLRTTLRFKEYSSRNNSPRNNQKNCRLYVDALQLASGFIIVSQQPKL